MSSGAELGERFWSKVDKGGPTPAHQPELGPCWVWTAALNAAGYGMYWHGGQMVLAYHLTVGAVAEDLERDHLCRRRACVRPTHIEAVTHQVNMARGVFGTRTHCPWEHPYTPENTFVVAATGHRQCRICQRVRAYQQRIRRGETKGHVMSMWDYDVSRKIVATDPPFEALIMAAMRKADTANAHKLRTAYPAIWDEVEARYNAPGGLLPGDLDGLPVRAVPDRSL